MLDCLLVTLYELMVVNNWYILMVCMSLLFHPLSASANHQPTYLYNLTQEGFVSETHNAARLYFIMFWLTTTVTLFLSVSSDINPSLLYCLYPSLSFPYHLLT